MHSFSKTICTAVAGCAWLALTAVGFAQPGGSGEITGLSDVYGKMLPYSAVALGVVAAFILFIVLLRRLRFRSSLEGIEGLSMTDVSSLQKKGLLTEEESRRVRQALSRQVERQLAVKKPSVAGASGLLIDPEVRRLEALAQEKAAGQQQRPPAVPEVPSGESNRQMPSVSPSAFQEESEPPAAELPKDAPCAECEEDVELPADVLSMVQLGLITAEEVARIKERIRSRRSQMEL